MHISLPYVLYGLNTKFYFFAFILGKKFRSIDIIRSDKIISRQIKMDLNFFSDIDIFFCNLIYYINIFSFIYRNNPIPPMYQLLLTLRLYATGSFLIRMGDFSGVSTTSAHRILHRVSEAIARLRPNVIHFPTTREEIYREQLQFYNIARFPKVIGCIDCTHIRVQSFGNVNFYSHFIDIC